MITKLYLEGELSDALDPNLTKDQLLQMKEDKLLKNCVSGTYIKNPDGTIDVYGDVDLSSNNLTSLTNFPFKFGKVTGDFDCIFNELTSLEGCPTSVGGSFSCYKNRIISLKGAPKEIGGHFNCFNNNITSLEGCPKSVGGSFYCGGNLTIFTEEDVRSVCKVKGKVVV